MFGSGAGSLAGLHPHMLFDVTVPEPFEIGPHAASWNGHPYDRKDLCHDTPAST